MTILSAIRIHPQLYVFDAEVRFPVPDRSKLLPLHHLFLGRLGRVICKADHACPPCPSLLHFRHFLPRFGSALAVLRVQSCVGGERQVLHVHSRHFTRIEDSFEGSSAGCRRSCVLLLAATCTCGTPEGARRRHHAGDKARASPARIRSI